MSKASAKVETNFSENEDDPELDDSSSEEWDEEEKKKRVMPKRTPQRAAKKQKVSHEELSSDDYDDEELEEEEEAEEGEEGESGSSDENQTDKKNGMNEPDSITPKISKVKTQNAAEGSEISNTSFMNGGFVILKKDVQELENNRSCLWRVDGKALLQKYEAFEEDGIVRHRNTSVYTGWTPVDIDLYYPVTVKVVQHQGQNMVVELNWEKLKEIHNGNE